MSVPELSRAARPITRLTVVLPEGSDPAAAALADLLAAELGTYGVQVARHVRGLPPEGAFRADVALWLPEPDGLPRPPEPAEAPARVQVGLCGSDRPTTAGVSGYDAVLCPHGSLVEPVRRVADRVAGRAPDVLALRLPLRAPVNREAEKLARRVEDRPVVLLDLRRGFERDVERVVFQLALMSRPAHVVMLVPHEDRARGRARQLAERHGVEAWLASGKDALPSSIGAADVLVGRPRYCDLALAAATSTDVLWLSSEDDAPDGLISSLREGRAVGVVEGVLMLAAALDRRLADPGAFRSEGTLLAEALAGDTRRFLEELGSLKEHVATPRGTAAWERIGPSRGDGKEAAVVEAKAGPGPDRAERIEEELLALKARMKDGA